MANLFARIGAFLGFLLVVYLGVLSAVSTFVTDDDLRHLVRKYSNIPLGLARRGDSSMLRFREAARSGPVDVVFLGSSHCYRSIDPRFFAGHDLKTFNLGSTGQTPLTSYYLLREYLDRLRPKLVVYELYWGVMDQDGTESALDLLANLPRSWNSADMALHTRSLLAVNGMLATYLDWRRTSIRDVAPNLHPEDTYIPGGYVETDRPSLDSTTVSTRTYRIRFHSDQMDYLNKIARELQRRGISLILVSTPVSEPYWRSIENYPEWSRTINRFADVHGLRYLDFNRDADLHAVRLFYDIDHLNAEGVQVFDRSLYEALGRVPSFRRLVARAESARAAGR
jgi:hypothetical protein